MINISVADESSWPLIATLLSLTRGRHNWIQVDLAKKNILEDAKV
jgi:hypothetical protein